MKAFLIFFLISIFAIKFSFAIRIPAAKSYTLFFYKDTSVYHYVKVTFLDKTKILFEMRLLSKASGKTCTINGIAYANAKGGTEIDTDENGNGYPSTAYNFLSKDKAEFISFRFQGVKDFQHSRRLQISASVHEGNGCNYNSSDYILSRK